MADLSPLARAAWLVTVGVLLITVLILVVQGYYGYAGVTFAVAVAAGHQPVLSARGQSSSPGRTRSSGSRWISTSAPLSRPAITS